MPPVCCGLVEVKKSAFNDNTVCQTIGYYIAKKPLKEDVIAMPLVILFCEDKLRFIFFPFISDNSAPCFDAVVTQSIAIMDERYDDVIDKHWFAFVCLFLREMYGSSVFLAASKYGVKSHEKKVYCRPASPAVQWFEEVCMVEP